MACIEIASLIIGSCGALAGLVGLAFARRSARAANESAKAAKVSSAAAVRANELQEQQFSMEQRARLVWVDILYGWEFSQQNADVGTFTMAFRNEGLSAAYDLSLSLFFHHNGRHTYGHSASGSFDETSMRYGDIVSPSKMKPGAIFLFKEEAYRRDFGDGDHRYITIVAEWRDGLGKHVAHLRVRKGGAWGSKDGNFAVISEVIDGSVVQAESPKLREMFGDSLGYEYPAPKS